MNQTPNYARSPWTAVQAPPGAGEARRFRGLRRSAASGRTSKAEPREAPGRQAMRGPAANQQGGREGPSAYAGREATAGNKGGRRGGPAGLGIVMARRCTMNQEVMA